MLPRLAAIGSATALLAMGCGTKDTPLADGCTGDRSVIVRALRTAPAQVALPDGTALSRCLADGTDDAELQNVGLAFSGVADALRVSAREGDRASAVQLGFLIGAARRGGAHTNGVMAELVRRIELVGGRLTDEVPADVGRALQQGLDAGERRG